jgi:hypothetical protein
MALLRLHPHLPMWSSPTKHWSIQLLFGLGQSFNTALVEEDSHLMSLVTLRLELLVTRSGTICSHCQDSKTRAMHFIPSCPTTASAPEGRSFFYLQLATQHSNPPFTVIRCLSHLAVSHWAFTCSPFHFQTLRFLHHPLVFPCCCLSSVDEGLPLAALDYKKYLPPIFTL